MRHSDRPGMSTGRRYLSSSLNQCHPFPNPSRIDREGRVEKGARQQIKRWVRENFNTLCIKYSRSLHYSAASLWPHTGQKVQVLPVFCHSAKDRTFPGHDRLPLTWWWSARGTRMSNDLFITHRLARLINKQETCSPPLCTVNAQRQINCIGLGCVMRADPVSP